MSRSCWCTYFFLLERNQFRTSVSCWKMRLHFFVRQRLLITSRCHFFASPLFCAPRQLHMHLLLCWCDDGIHHGHGRGMQTHLSETSVELGFYFTPHRARRSRIPFGIVSRCQFHLHFSLVAARKHFKQTNTGRTYLFSLPSTTKNPKNDTNACAMRYQLRYFPRCSCTTTEHTKSQRWAVFSFQCFLIRFRVKAAVAAL